MKQFGLIVGFALAAIACATGADMVGEMMDASVPDAGAQQSKSVTCSEQATNGGNAWFGYALVDVGDAKFPNVTVRITYPSWEDLWQTTSEIGGLPPGRYVSESQGGTFVDGKLVVHCTGTEESITVFYRFALTQGAAA